MATLVTQDAEQFADGATVTNGALGAGWEIGGTAPTARTAAGDPIHTVSVQRGDSSVGSLPSSV